MPIYPIYTIAVICAIMISSIALIFIFRRLKLLNFRTLFSVTLASLICAAALPGLFSLISSNTNKAVGGSSLLSVTAAVIAIYIIIAFTLSLVIAHIIPRIGAKQEVSAIKTLDMVLPEVDMVKENYLEQIYDIMGYEKDIENSNNVENVDEVENNLEKSVDTSENIDKMGIENMKQDSEILSIDECIEEAFRLKEQGDAEGAILYFMYALDKKPHKELVFWIVLDICVIYKAFGQQELAFDILNSYNDVFGDIMDVSVRTEIENNLSDIQV